MTTKINKQQKVCVEFLVKGKVQGVLFRDTTKRHADSIGVVGTVENLRDKVFVKAIVCGTSEEVESMHEFLKRGPPNARVER